jgi:hypothetical protein
VLSQIPSIAKFIVALDKLDALAASQRELVFGPGNKLV